MLSNATHADRCWDHPPTRRLSATGPFPHTVGDRQQLSAVSFRGYRPQPMAITNLARPIDPRFSSNRLILGLGVVATAAGFARWNNGDLAETTLTAVSIGILVGITWAFTREIDPDRPTSATLAAIAVGALAMFVDSLPILPLAGLMVAGRILIRSTGKPPTAVDLVALTAGSYWIGRSGAGWVAALVLAFAIARDRTLPGLAVSRLARIVVPFAIPIVASFAVARHSEEMWIAPPWWAIAVALIGLAAAVFMPAYHPVSRCDLRGQPLEPRRLQSARRVLIVGALLISSLGEIGLMPMLPAWLAFTAVWVSHRTPVPEFHPISEGAGETD